MEERRKYIRINDNVKIRYHPLKSLLGSSSVTRNISAGGLCFPTLLRLEPGKILELIISLPGYNEQLPAKGKVVWLEEINNNDFRFLLGIEFVDINAVTYNRIRSYLWDGINR